MSGIPVPFADITKPTNDVSRTTIRSLHRPVQTNSLQLLNKDFYHTTKAALELKSKAPNGVTFNVKNKLAHDGPITGSVRLLGKMKSKY